VTTRPSNLGAIAAVMLLTLSTGCVQHVTPRHPATSQVTVGPGVVVTTSLTQNASTLGLHEAAAPAGAAQSLTGSAMRALHAPVLITATTALPANTRLSFTVPAQSLDKSADTAFLASYDPGTRRWTPVQSSWNADRTVLSGVVSHFSIWAPITWVADRVKAAVIGAFSSIFQPLLSRPTPPTCDSTADNFLIDDSVLNDSIQTCAQIADQHSATLKVTNTRSYAVDLLSPSTGEVSTNDIGSVAARLGAALTASTTKKAAGVTRTLLPAGATATITLLLEPGSSKTVRTEIDNEAWAVSTLDTALSEVAFVYGHLASTTFSHPDPAATAKFVDHLLTELASAKCLLRAQTELKDVDPLTLDTARTLGSVVFECLSAVAADVAGLVFASAVGVIVSLGDALIQAATAGVDTAMRQSMHTIRIDRITIPTAVQKSVEVPAVQQLVDTGIGVRVGQHIRITATGQTTYGYEGAGCVGTPTVTPDGQRALPSGVCGPKIDPTAELPTAPIGALIARVASGPWIVVGGRHTFIAARSGELVLSYNEVYWSDDTGSYEVIISVS
jgi:hypothetical protein